MNRKGRRWIIISDHLDDDGKVIGVVSEDNMFSAIDGVVRGQKVVDIIEKDYFDTVTQYPCVAITNKDKELNLKG